MKSQKMNINKVIFKQQIGSSATFCKYLSTYLRIKNDMKIFNKTVLLFKNKEKITIDVLI